MTLLEVVSALGAAFHAITILVLAYLVSKLLHRVRVLERAQTTITITGVDPSQVTVTDSSTDRKPRP